MIAAGRLRDRVTLQSKGTPGRDAMGGEVITWVDVATIWADVQPLTGRALIAAQQAASEVTTRILIRRRADIRPDWRVRHLGQVYSVLAIVPDGEGVGLDLQCSLGLRHD